MILFNLIQYLKDALPNERIYVESRLRIGAETSIPARNIVVRETGGETRRVVSVPSFQIICRDEDPVKARELAEQVQTAMQTTETIGGRFGQLLPAVTVNGTTYPEIQVAQINAIAFPQSMGADPDGYFEFTQNFQVYFKGV